MASGRPGRVLHVPYTYAPDPVGGTEVYVAALAAELDTLGVESAIAAPQDGAGLRSYEVDGRRVHRFGAGAAVDELSEMRGDGDPRAAALFARIVARERPDVVHVHAFTRAVSPRLLAGARDAGAATVFTYHSPTVSCERGTLLLGGETPCDGRVLVRRCADCSLEARGVPRAARAILSRVPPRVGAAVARSGVGGRAWTGVRSTQLIDVRRRALGRVFESADVVVAVCDWVRDLLLRNGAPAERVVLSRQGVATGGCDLAHDAAERLQREPADGEAQRVAFLGRLAPEKGIATLLRAVREHQSLHLTLDVYGVAQHEVGSEYRRALAALVDGDARVRFLEPVAPSAVVRTLAGYDLLAVPSEGLETGPLVVLESFAAGTPVIGSDLGGIAELVTHGADGVLVRAGDVAAWGAALLALCDSPSAVRRLRDGVRPPRTMCDAAADMLAVYTSLVPRLA